MGPLKIPWAIQLCKNQVSTPSGSRVIATNVLRMRKHMYPHLRMRKRMAKIGRGFEDPMDHPRIKSLPLRHFIWVLVVLHVACYNAKSSSEKIELFSFSRSSV
ncbi:hypothetical protein AVEN_33813-1 [Araneus ventricosus]|uniref:Uncharacterized protein n=1 Tax=Araneus ventricosus TaxID=182803 RepID=A0A4Y2NU89_ARAVE|nr:hypothetical protein AVEN_33813-1 [Araneus ventricosus]